MNLKRGIIIGIIILVLFVIIFNVTKKQDLISQPSCGDKKEFFSIYPIDLNIVKRITPQGELGGGIHVFPVKHVYTLDEYSPKGYSYLVNRPKIEMVSPGDITITGISKYWDKNRGDEYYLDFSICKELSGSFFHLSEISPKLKQEFEKNKNNHEDIQELGQVTFKTIYSNVNIEVNAGEVIGYASIKSSQMFDFNLIDTRVPELNFINKERFTKHRAFDLLHEVCPYDYFIPEVKTKLYSMISDYMGKGKKRTIEPLCGEYMQDVPNTAQGIWFLKNTGNGEQGNENIIEREILHLALAHEAYDPQRPIISIGSLKGLEPILYFIEPKSQGLVNRDWKDIVSDGNIYCSDLVFDDDHLTPAGKSIILQMPTSTTLKIEAINSPCSTESWSFTNNVSEFER